MIYQQNFHVPHLDQNAEFNQLLNQISSALSALKKKHDHGQLPLFDLCHNFDDLEPLYQIQSQFQFKNIFILGTGGSSLGGKSLCELNQSGINTHTTSPTLHFIDNIDPQTINIILNRHDLKQCGFIVISKSGSTSETLCQFLIILQHMKTLVKDDQLAQHFVMITEPTNNPMRAIGTKHGLKILDHPTQIGGRFSVLSLVGLLPAVLAGVDIKAVRQGAREVYEATFENDFNQPSRGAAYAVHMIKTGKSLTVMMPYSDRLKVFAAWYSQLWAESLGKQGQGSTPLAALGTVDQHSQLQLFLDGPQDKSYTLILLHQAHQGTKFDLTNIDCDSISYFKNKTVGDLMDAEQRATTQSLINHHCPVRTLTLSSLDARSMGALLMHFMLETMLAAELMDINAFDQPAVEESKVLTRQYMQEPVIL